MDNTPHGVDENDYRLYKTVFQVESCKQDSFRRGRSTWLIYTPGANGIERAAASMDWLGSKSAADSTASSPWPLVCTEVLTLLHSRAKQQKISVPAC